MKRDEAPIESCEAGTEALARAVSACNEKMPAEARDAVRGRLVAAISPEAMPLRARLLRPMIALAAAGSMLGGVSYAAAVSAPGDLLYPVKRTVTSAYESAHGRVDGRVTPKEDRAPAGGVGNAKPRVENRPKAVKSPAEEKAGKPVAKPSAVTTPGSVEKGGSHGKAAAPNAQPKRKTGPKSKAPKKSGKSGSTNGSSRSSAHRPAAASKR